ncbi:MAG: hypothetical protein ACKO5F_03385 [Synechococcus sp.]
MTWSTRNHDDSLSGRMRELMFGDLPLGEWIRLGQGGEPWASFSAARLRMDTEPEAARRLLEDVLAMPRLESRHALQAWQALRELGIRPPSEQAQQVLGVIVEVALPGGLDVLGAYRDGTARYWNHAGAGVVWERPDLSLDRPVQELLAAAAALCRRIGPWDGPRPRDLPENYARLSILTPSGLHFGQGPFQDLAADALGAPTIQAATRLMTALTQSGAADRPSGSGAPGQQPQVE